MKRSLFPLALILFLFLFSCQNSSNQFDHRPLSDSISVSGLSGDSVKLIKTASVNFKVKNVQQGIKTVAVLAQEFGGIVTYQSFRAVEGDKKELQQSTDSLLVITTSIPQADLTVRIPSTKLETFLFDVADIGYFVAGSELKIDDKSLTYLENALKQKSRQNALTPRITRRNDSDTTTETIAVSDEAIQKFIANKTIDGEAAYSTVSLNLSQNRVVRKEMIANYVLTDYELPFGQRLVNSLSAGWDYFLNLILALLHLWIFIVLGIAIYLVYRHYLQRRTSLKLDLKS